MAVKNIDLLEKSLKIVELCGKTDPKVTMSDIEGRDYIYFYRGGEIISSPITSIEEAFGWISAYKEHSVWNN